MEDDLADLLTDANIKSFGRRKIRDDAERAAWGASAAAVRYKGHPPQDSSDSDQSVCSTPARRVGRGRRASHRVGRSGSGGGSGGGEDGAGEPPPPPTGPIRAGAEKLLTLHDLAARWSIASQTVKNRLCKNPHSLPVAFRLPGAAGPRWRLRDIIDFESAAPLYREPPPRPRGRPRISKGSQS